MSHPVDTEAGVQQGISVGGTTNKPTTITQSGVQDITPASWSEGLPTIGTPFIANLTDASPKIEVTDHALYELAQSIGTVT